MAILPRFFQFHDIAAAAISSDSLFARDFFDAEYGYHRAQGSPQGLPFVSLDFHLDSSVPAGFTRHTHKLLARWNYRLAIKPAQIDLRVHGNQASVSMVHHMLVHPSLRWLAAGSQTLLLHAGAVAKNNKSLIFTGQGGAGKTTTTSLVLASGQGWQIHADDYVFITGSGTARGGQSKAYVTRSHLYRGLQKWVPAIRSRLTTWERVRLEFFGALREYTREGLKWPVRLSPQRLWPGVPIADTASPAAILLLERADVPSAGLIPINNLDQSVEDLLEMNFGEARHFLSLLQKAGSLDDRWLSAWQDLERSLLSNILSNYPAYRLVLPVSGAPVNLLPILDELVS